MRQKRTLRQIAPPLPATDVSPAGDVWLLNLDQIEPHTGRLLNKTFVDHAEVGASTHAFDTGNVLYSKLRPYLNKVLLPEAPGFCTSELVPLRPNPDLVSREYLAAYLRSPKFLAWVEQQVDGAKMPRVSMKIFWDHEIDLPLIDEQKRITAILERAGRLRRKREDAIRLADDFLRAVFFDMFGDPVTNPKGLPVKKLGEVCRFFAGNSLPDGDPFEGQTGGVLHLKVGDMNLPGNEESVGVAREWSLTGAGGIIAPRGSILIPKRGGAIATNKKRILLRPAALDPNLMAILPSESLRLEVLAAWFKQFDLTTISSGSAVPQLNKGDLAPLTIFIPPEPLQHKFEAIAERVKRLGGRYKLQQQELLVANAALASRLLG